MVIKKGILTKDLMFLQKSYYNFYGKYFHTKALHPDENFAFFGKKTTKLMSKNDIK